MPAALLVVVAALATLVGAPAVASDVPALARSVVGDPARPPAPATLAAGPSRPVKWTGQTVRLAVRSRSALALPLLALAVLGRAAVARAGWSRRGRTPGRVLGRAPPAYALALA